jgi:hypothetical protein
VVFIRMDLEAMSGDPTESLNYEMPGVIPATRMGETFTGEQVRVDFTGPAGASAMRTSAPTRVVLPFGAEDDSKRVLIEGEEPGYIAFYDENGELVGYLDGSQWAIGDLATPGARVTLDPIGGFRLRSADDSLVTILDQNGYSLREAASGLVTAEIKAGSFRMVDPTGSDDIEMVTSSTGSLPNPAYRAASEASPGSSLTVPAAPLFTTPADDIEVGHVAAWLRVTNQAATMTPPAGWTERLDNNYLSAAGTLQSSIATRDVATGTTGDFTSTQSNWQLAVGTHVVIKGGGTTSPSYRSVSSADVATAAGVATVSITKPAGVVAGDVLITHVAMGISGGFLPTGWTTPEGFVFLGANYLTTGTGTSQSTLAVGCWAKLAGASEPATYSTTINLPAGLKAVSGSMVAIQNPFLVGGGVQIRLAGHPIRRLLDYVELTAASATLCDFQNIPQTYEHLEVIFDTTSRQNGGASNGRIRMRYNGDTANNYFYQLFEVENAVAAVDTAAVGFLTDRILLTGLSAVDGAASGAQMNILGYAKTGSRKIMLGQGYWAADAGLNLRNGKLTGQWSGTAINRITIESNNAPLQFLAGSRAYLYGY